MAVSSVAPSRALPNVPALMELGIKVNYLHSDVETLERIAKPRGIKIAGARDEADCLGYVEQFGSEQIPYVHNRPSTISSLRS